MAKKNRIPFRHDVDGLTTIDEELDEAIARLDGANHRINELLQTVAPPGPQAASLDEPGEQANVPDSPSAVSGTETLPRNP
jgi:hypothetical protein